MDTHTFLVRVSSGGGVTIRDYGTDRTPCDGKGSVGVHKFCIAGNDHFSSIVSAGLEMARRWQKKQDRDAAAKAPF